ncbi:hypothetical protein CLOM_g11106 [Closterium sp. NIES-68]|nr:hypothetical protein CLOM_g19752 [Closterium sp. NIES-68]GJP51980.1 hypothetical protein CLOM_g11106 [Closterium sp. NIES-68]GJP65146.1 hypothetical protein CLOP_g22050 [Closterium sp. NIES-67]GJP83815.1 hypothetical protein CLOP_g13916 [Closterium sp. NIES-67]
MVEAAEQPNSVPRPRTVLVAVNGSDASDAALLFALKSIISDQDTLIILHVRPTDKDLTSLYSSYPDPEAEIKTHHAFIRATINDAARVVRSQGFPAARVKVEEGDPRKVIPKVAEAEKADLVVLGSQGKRTLHYMLAGDVASHCAKKCSCAVITYKSANGGSVVFNKRGLQEQKRLGISLGQFKQEADVSDVEAAA